MFVPSYMPDYSGHHWAVYDNNDNFCGYDDGDTTSGETLECSGVATIVISALHW